MDKFNERFFSKKTKTPEETRVENIKLKIKDAAYSMQTFGSATKQGSFVNGALWSIHNLSDDDIKFLRDNTDKDDFSFFGM